jgi:hemerythrin
MDGGIEWNDRYLLGYAPMDRTHEEFVGLAAALLAADDAGLPAAFDALAEHTEAHFAQEREWMLGSDFPATDCHVEEHDKVLHSMREVRKRLAGGDAALARRLGRELLRWFPAHADYMDAALAQWMVRRRSGGTPVVLRRAAGPRAG